MTREILPSSTMSAFQLASEKKARGETVYNFAAGDPALANHPAILEMTNKKASVGKVPYPPAEGILELREAFTNWINRTCQIDYKPDEAAVTCGGKFALYAILACYLNPGDEVLLIAPYYVTYPAIVTMLEGKSKVIMATPEKGWKISGKDIERHATTKTKFIFLNNASNPTGALYNYEEILDILTTTKKLGITVISDEVYSGLVYSQNEPFISCGRFPEFKENVFIVQSCSKNFAMSGWRVGFLLGDKSKLARIKAFQQQTTSGVSLLSQWGALGALLKADEVNLYVKTAFETRLKLFITTFNSLFSEKLDLPHSALYAFVPLPAMGINPAINSMELADTLIKEGNIATVPGEAFGVPGYLRFACSESEKEIEEGVRQLHKVIKKLY